MIDTWGAPQWTNLVAEPVYTPVAYGWKAFLIITLNHFSTNPYPILSHIFGHSCIPNMHPYLGTKFQNFSKFKMDSFSFSWTHLVVCATLYATSPPSESKSLLLRLIYRPHYYPVFFLQWRREGGQSSWAAHYSGLHLKGDIKEGAVSVECWNILTGEIRKQ